MRMTAPLMPVNVVGAVSVTRPPNVATPPPDVGGGGTGGGAGTALGAVGEMIDGEDPLPVHPAASTPMTIEDAISTGRRNAHMVSVSADTRASCLRETTLQLTG